MSESLCKLYYECRKVWSDLKDTNSPNIKFCDHCNQNVHWADTEEQRQEYISKRKCIAFEEETVVKMGLFVDRKSAQRDFRRSLVEIRERKNWERNKD